MICKHCQHNNPESNRFCGMCGQTLSRPQATTVTTSAPAAPAQSTSTLGLRQSPAPVSTVPPFPSKPQSAAPANGEKKVQFPPIAPPPQPSTRFGQPPPAAPDDPDTVVRISPHPVETAPVAPIAAERKTQLPSSLPGPLTSAPMDDKRAAADKRGPFPRSPLGPQSAAAGTTEVNSEKKVPVPSPPQSASPATPERRAQNPPSYPQGPQTQSGTPASPARTSAVFEKPAAAPAKTSAVFAKPAVPENGAPKPKAETQPLPLQQRPATGVVPPKKVQTSAPVRVTGPSFLGLSDDPVDDRAKDYDDLYKTNWGGRIAVVFVILVIASCLAYLQWRSGHPLQASAPAAGPSPASNAANPTASAAQPAVGASASTKTNSETTGSDPAIASKNSAASSSQPKTDTQPAAAPAGTQDRAGAQPASAAKTVAASSAAGADPIREGREVVAGKSQEDLEEPVRLAENYIQGKSVAHNCNAALSILRSASDRGNPRAEIKLGALYATGNCVAPDRVEAYRYFSRAIATQPNNTWLEQSRSSLWSNMSATERKQAMEVEK
jgi:hypothetical protein